MGSEFHHEALFYEDQDEFLAGTVPFAREALELNQAGPDRGRDLKGQAA